MVISTTDTFMSAFTVFWHFWILRAICRNGITINNRYSKLKCSHSFGVLLRKLWESDAECGVEITSILFCSKNLFTCFILLINMVGNSAVLHENVILEHYTLMNGWWITRFCSQFQNNSIILSVWNIWWRRYSNFTLSNSQFWDTWISEIPLEHN